MASGFWNALQTSSSSYSLTFQAHARYRRNADDYRKAHIIRALAVLTLYQSESGAGSVFAPHELKEIQARLMLSQKTFGGLIDDLYLGRVYEKQASQWLDTRGHNWELLRQRAEAEGLYFEPLDMPDGNTTHAFCDRTRGRGSKRERRLINVSQHLQTFGDTRLLAGAVHGDEILRRGKPPCDRRSTGPRRRNDPARALRA